MKIRAAQKVELNEILSVIEEAKAIMRQSGNLLQWANGYPSRAVILDDINKGYGYVIEESGSIVAYFAFIPSPEPTYAYMEGGQWLSPDKPYHVIHRIGSLPGVHGIMKALLDWCFMKDGNIRIDTHRDNHIMQHCLEKYGFSYRGIIYLENGDERMAYQKMNDSNIRRASASDLKAVNKLLGQVLAVHHEGRPDLFKPTGKKYTDTELLAIFSNPETPVFVYDKEGSVLGYVFCAFEHKGSSSMQELTTLYVDDICVDENARGMHVGTALFEYVKAFAIENGCHNITLHVWECNPGARVFYESLGLTPQYTSMEFILQ